LRLKASGLPAADAEDRATLEILLGLDRIDYAISATTERSGSAFLGERARGLVEEVEML